MKKILLVFIIFNLSFIIGYAQVNLVVNPSFEIYDTCVYDTDQLKLANFWFKPTKGTSDYFNECYTPSGNVVDVPDNFMGYQFAKEGKAYAGLFVYYYDPVETYREYIQSQLISPLQAGTKYFVSFYASLSDSTIYASDDIGAYISTNSISSINYDSLPYMPQIENTQGSFITDKFGWTFISSSYIASGGENYITIGNFKGDETTDTLYVGGGNIANIDYKSAYYYVDAVCISTDSLYCATWTAINEKHKDESVIFYPNPSDGHFDVKSLSSEKSTIKIFDSIGREVYNNIFYSQLSINTSSYPQGFYIIQINNNGKRVNKQLMIKH